MVTFCTSCGGSLPLADIILRDGMEVTRPGYACPDCKTPAPPVDDGLIPADGENLILRNGRADIE